MRDASLPGLKYMSALVSGLFNIQAHICLILISFHTEMKRAHVPKASLFFFSFSEYICWSQKRYFSLQNLPEVKLSALLTQNRAEGRGTLSWIGAILERCRELWVFCSSKLWQAGLWHSLNVRQECYEEGGNGYSLHRQGWRGTTGELCVVLTCFKENTANLAASEMTQKDYCRNITWNESVSYGEGRYVILKQFICRLDKRKPAFTLKK